MLFLFRVNEARIMGLDRHFQCDKRTRLSDHGLVLWFVLKVQLFLPQVLCLDSIFLLANHLIVLKLCGDVAG